MNSTQSDKVRPRPAISSTSKILARAGGLLVVNHDTQRSVREYESACSGTLSSVDAISAGTRPPRAMRSEERRVGKECVRTCRSRWSPYHAKKKNNNNQRYQWTSQNLK